MMTPGRSSGCGACIPELTTRRHHGQSQAPWTVAGAVDGCYAQAAEPKHPYFGRGIDVSRAVPHSMCLFVRSDPLLLATKQMWYHSATSSTEFDST